MHVDGAVEATGTARTDTILGDNLGSSILDNLAVGKTSKVVGSHVKILLAFNDGNGTDTVLEDKRGPLLFISLRIALLDIGWNQSLRSPILDESILLLQMREKLG